MSTTVASKTDVMYEILYNPTEFIPVPSSRVNVKTTVVDNKPSYLMKNHATGTYYDLDELTNLIWSLTDGKRTVSQIVNDVQRQKPKVREKTVFENLLFFADSNLLEGKSDEKPKKRFRVVSSFEMAITLIRNSHGFINSLHSRIHLIFKRWLLWVTIGFIVAAAVLFAREFVSIYGQKANFEIMGSSVVGFFFYYFVPLAPVIAIHEIAHAITLVHFGGQAGEMGTGLFYFSPMFYTDTTDAWGLTRGQRMQIYLAGNISTLLIGAALVFIHLFVQIPGFASHIVLMVSFYCFSMSLMNFAPPFETDGYYILSDAVKMPNLRYDSYGYLGSVVRRFFGKPVKKETSGLTKRKKWIFLFYGLVSVAWIVYIIFQTSLFLVYMGQDVTIALGNIGGAIVSSQAIPIAAVVIATLSSLYFGMQLTGYTFAFSSAVKKAVAKPLTLEAIHDRDLTVFEYLPPDVPEFLCNRLKSRMEKISRKFTPKFEVKPVGRSCMATLRMGGTNLALVQIKEHLKRIEKQFNSAYEKLILSHKDTIQRSIGVYSPQKIRLTNAFKQFATESTEAGNSTALHIARACEKNQEETLLYLLQSACGTVWTIEVPPSQEYEFQKELAQSLLLEDMTLTDLYHDTENFKKRVIYGFDSLMVLAADTETAMKEGLAKPDEYQCLSVLEPVKSRLIFVGRTEPIENKLEAFAPVFLTYTWAGYTDNLLCETCLKLATIKRARLPDSKEIEELSIGELAVLSKDLILFDETRDLVDRRIKKTMEQFAKMNQSLTEVQHTAESVEGFKIGMLEAVLRVNVENMTSIPGRIRCFQKDWSTMCRRIGKVQKHVQQAYDEMKPGIEKRKRHLLLFSPFIVMTSVLLLVLGLKSVPTPWSIILFSLSAAVQVAYWTFSYRAWNSARKVTKYSAEPFKAVHTVLLALTEAVFGYVATEDTLTLDERSA